MTASLPRHRALLAAVTAEAVVAPLVLWAAAETTSTPPGGLAHRMHRGTVTPQRKRR